MPSTGNSERIALESDTPLDDIDRHFRVFAGPGAGKTHWLALHVAAVVRTSERLVPGARVACISYTNVAVSQLLERIGDAAHRVEAATIHAFLYRNVVRPYLHLLRDPGTGLPLVAHELVDGHDEHRPTYPLVNEWHRRIGIPFRADHEQTYQYLKALHWVRDAATGAWELKLMASRRPVQYLPTTRLAEYKPVYWERGIIDHDDVLYLAFRILEENRGLCEFLAARFPYVFVDEFQDTNPVQTQIVTWMAEAGSTVGVIGDVAQSIYGFQGAKPEEFLAFSLPDMDNYEIVGNRRSTDTIVRLLNSVRRDGLTQRALRQEEGREIVVFVGEAATMVQATRDWLEGEPLVVLAYRNDEIQAIRDPGSVAGQRLWAAFTAADFERAAFFEKVLRGAELSAQGRYAAGVREALPAFRLRSKRFRDPLRYDATPTESERKGLVVSLLEWLTTNREAMRDAKLLDVYRSMSEYLGQVLPGVSLKGVSAGTFKTFAESTRFGSLLASVRSIEETRDTRTIHQSKGDEFPNVLVCLRDEKTLISFLESSAPDDEEHRVCYVAASRACDGLFFCVPTMATTMRLKVRRAGVVVVGGEADLVEPMAATSDRDIENSTA